RFRFGREGQAAGQARQIQRFDSHAIPCQQQPAFTGVVKSKGEHASQAEQSAPDPPRLDGRPDYLRVGAGPEPESQLEQLLPELEVVIDLAVEDDDVLTA